MELVLALSIVRVGRADGRCWNCAKRNRLDDGSCSHCVKSRARAARLYCAVEVASVPVAASGSLLGGLSLAAAGGVCSASGARSGVDDASDVDALSDDVVDVAVSVSDATTGADGPLGASLSTPFRSGAP